MKNVFRMCYETRKNIFGISTSFLDFAVFIGELPYFYKLHSSLDYTAYAVVARTRIWGQIRGLRITSGIVAP